MKRPIPLIPNYEITKWYVVRNTPSFQVPNNVCAKEMTL